MDSPKPSSSQPKNQEAKDPGLKSQEPKNQEKAHQVREMFGAIARRYDLLNRLLSLGIDRAWRREATARALEKVRLEKVQGDAPRILDVATGTADLALALKKAAPRAEVIGVDFVSAMLELGRAKAAKQGVDVRLEQGDGLALDFPDNSFDALTIAYGLRNFADYEEGLSEFYRVLKPGGRLVVLEFPPPPKGPFGQLFRVYFLKVVPILGGLLSGRRSAYTYLPDSVLKFPKPAELAAMMEGAGFRNVRYTLQTFGVSALHVGDKVGVRGRE